MKTHATHTDCRPAADRHHGLWKVWTASLLGLLVFATPLVVSWQLTGVNPVQAAFTDDTNPRANYWRAVREGVSGYTAVVGQETDVLILNSGENWRQVRNGIITTLGAGLLAFTVVALVLFHLVVGKARLGERTGRKVLRWTLFERILHWYVAILFIILTLTGLSLLYGRAVLIPVMGPEAFAAYADFAKDAHNYLALFFVAGLVLMLAIWVRDNFFTKVDWQWFKAGGGYFGKKQHPHAYKVNGGEKVWFWILLVAGIAVMISGLFLLFPNYGFDRPTMQGGLVIHGIASLILIAFSLGHIYLGTLGNEGTFEGMIGGEVDEAWARKHHDLWYQQTQEAGRAAPKVEETPAAHPPPQATQAGD
jgi:formate dehydrogenase subunit gamma